MHLPVCLGGKSSRFHVRGMDGGGCCWNNPACGGALAAVCSAWPWNLSCCRKVVGSETWELGNALVSGPRQEARRLLCLIMYSIRLVRGGCVELFFVKIKA